MTRNAARRMIASTREQEPSFSMISEKSEMSVSPGPAMKVTDGFTTSGKMSVATPRIIAMLKMQLP